MKREYVILNIETVRFPHTFITTTLSGGTGDNPTEAHSDKFWSLTEEDEEEEKNFDLD